MLLIWLKVCRSVIFFIGEKSDKVATVVTKGGAAVTLVLSRKSGVTQGYFGTAIFLPKIAYVC